MPKVAKGRSRIALLATIAVLASLFVIPAAPAAAATGDVEGPATFSACVGDATASAGFTDTSGSFAQASIDCIAYYGVTTGTTATTYSPADLVTRGQMALFLVRAAGPAGITVPAATDQGLTDIAGQPQAYQDAINQLVDLGISIGIGNNMYGPDQPVARYEMALFLYRFLDLQNDGNLDGDVEDGPGDFSSGLTDTGSVSVSAFNAIESVYDLGITKGTSTTTFSPYDAVSREQMAAFIARTLAHTNARPQGVTLQIVPSTGFSPLDVDLQISVRDANFAPVVDAPVDVFEADLADQADALKTDGTCDTTVVSASYGGTVCTIELAEAVATNASGNFFDDFSVSDDTIWWAWTGSTGATFDVDTTDVSAATVDVTDGPSEWKVTTTIPKYAMNDGSGNLVKYGTAVTHTFQLVDADGDNVALAGEKVKLQVSTSVDGDLTVATITGTSNASGTITFPLSATDPSSSADNETIVDITVLDTDGWGVDLAAVPNGTPDVQFDDEASTSETIVAGQAVEYTLASDTGSGATHTVTGTVYDQYGLGRSGQTVNFTSDDADGIDSTPIPRTTNSQGVATLAYSRDSSAAGIEVVTADNTDTGSDTVDHYWVLEAPLNYGTLGEGVVVADAANDAIVFIDGTPWVVYYDANDQFKVDGDADTYANFDKAVDEATGGEGIAITAYKDTAAGISQFDWLP